MNKIRYSFFVMLLMLGYSYTANAVETLVHQDRVITIANDQLEILNFDGTPAECIYEQPSQFGASAVEIIIDAETTLASITFDDSVEEIDISDCFADEFITPEHCFAQVDIPAGEFYVPCIAIVDEIDPDRLDFSDENGLLPLYQAEFFRRGHSHNWQLISAQLSELNIRDKNKDKEKKEVEADADAAQNGKAKGHEKKADKPEKPSKP